MRKVVLWVVAVAVVGAGCACSPHVDAGSASVVSGSGPIYTTLEQMGKKSSVLVIGRVTSNHVEIDRVPDDPEDKGVPMQIMGVDVADSRGDDVARHITVAADTSTDDVIVEDSFPRFEIGTTYAFFLEGVPKSERVGLQNHGIIYTPIGGQETIFRITGDRAESLEKVYDDFDSGSTVVTTDVARILNTDIRGGNRVMHRS